MNQIWLSYNFSTAVVLYFTLTQGLYSSFYIAVDSTLSKVWYIMEASASVLAVVYAFGAFT